MRGAIFTNFFRGPKFLLSYFSNSILLCQNAFQGPIQKNRFFYLEEKLLKHKSYTGAKLRWRNENIAQCDEMYYDAWSSFSLRGKNGGILTVHYYTLGTQYARYIYLEITDVNLMQMLLVYCLYKGITSLFFPVWECEPFIESHD